MRGKRVGPFVIPAVRIMAWVLLIIIVLLTLAPPAFRPSTRVPHTLEHAGIFLLAGIAFGLGYEAQRKLLAIGAIAFGAALELLQTMVPGRHARLGDFLIDATAGLVGVLVGAALSQTLGLLAKS